MVVVVDKTQPRHRAKVKWDGDRTEKKVNVIYIWLIDWLIDRYSSSGRHDAVVSGGQCIVDVGDARVEPCRPVLSTGADLRAGLSRQCQDTVAVRHAARYDSRPHSVLPLASRFEYISGAVRKSGKNRQNHGAFLKKGENHGKITTFCSFTYNLQIH